MRCAFGTGRAQRQSAKSCRIDDSKCWPGHARFSAVALFAPQTRSASVNREGSCSARFEKSFATESTESTETTEQSSVARASCPCLFAKQELGHDARGTSLFSVAIV